MKKCLVLSKFNNTEEKHNTGLWFLVDETEVEQLIEKLGPRFIFQFDLDEAQDEPLLSSF